MREVKPTEKAGTDRRDNRRIVNAYAKKARADRRGVG